MKLAICGTRDLGRQVAYGLIFDLWGLVKHRFPDVDMIVSGGGGDVDAAAEDIAPTLTGRYALVFKADWDKLGKKAGPIRNTRIAETSDYLLLIWDGESPGSADVLEKFERLGKPTIEVIVEDT